MSVLKKWVKIDGQDISKLFYSLGKIYITNIIAGQLIEKKKVFVEVPFRHGKIDVSYAFGDLNFYNDIPVTITAEIVGKVKKDKTISNAMEIYRRLRNFISNKIGVVEIETSDEFGVVYKSTHINIECEKGITPEHLIVTFNFEANPIKTKKVGGTQDYIACLDFDSMSIGDCWNSAFYVENAVIGKKYFFKTDGDLEEVVITVSKDTTIKINDVLIILNKGVNNVDTNYFKKQNFIILTEIIEFELYYKIETL